MCNNCGCNREFGFNDGYGYNRSEWNSGCGCNNDYYNDNAALYEAECVARAALTIRRRSVNRYLRTLITSLRHDAHVNHLINCLVFSY